jgi:hypothetical protein
MLNRNVRAVMRCTAATTKIALAANNGCQADAVVVESEVITEFL